MMENIKAMKLLQPSDSEAIIWLSLVINWRTQSLQPAAEADDLLDYVTTRFATLQTWTSLECVSKILVVRLSKALLGEMLEKEYRKISTITTRMLGQNDYANIYGIIEPFPCFK
jgi:hypothetical protein